MRSLNTLKRTTLNNDTLSKNRVALALNQTATTGSSLGGGGGTTAVVDLTNVSTNIIPTSNGSLNLGTSDKRFGTSFTTNINVGENIMPVGNLVSQIGGPSNWFGNIYVNHISCGANSIAIGGALISSNNGGVVLPASTTIGGVNPGTIVIKGTQANTGALPTTNAVGDGYIISSNLWVSTATNSVYPAGWVNVGAFVGPQGIQGIQGIPGPEGVLDTNGAIFSGTIVIPDMVVTGNTVMGKSSLGTPVYRLDVSGSLNASSIYQNGTLISSVYATTSSLSSYSTKAIIDASFALYYNKNQADASFSTIATNYYNKTYVDSSINSIISTYATTSYVGTQIANLIGGAPETLDTLAEIATAIKSDASFGIIVYEKIAASDASINNIRTTYALNSTVDASLNSYALNSTVDASLNSYAPTASLSSYATTASLSNYASLVSDISFGGNVQFGKTAAGISVGINKTPNRIYALDVSGASFFSGNVSLDKRSTDISYAYFDMSAVTMNVYNICEKFIMPTFSATPTFNYSTGSIFYVTPGASTNITSVSFTNVPVISGRSITMTVIIDNASGVYTSYITATAVSVNGTSITYKVQDGTAFAAPTAPFLVVHQFILLFTSGTLSATNPRIIGSMSTIK